MQHAFWSPVQVGSQHIFRRLTVALVAGALMALALCEGHAIGPTLPLEFLDAVAKKDSWTVMVKVDSKQIRIAKIEREIQNNGQKIRSEHVEPQYEKRAAKDRRGALVTVPLRFKGMEELKAGAYAQRIIVEGQWLSDPSARPLHIERWFYFVVKDGRIEVIDIDKYERITDLGKVTLDSHGKQTLAKQGHDVKEDVPLSQTKSIAAVPLGRFGGAREEEVREENRLSGKPMQKIDRSEVNED